MAKRKRQHRNKKRNTARVNASTTTPDDAVMEKLVKAVETNPDDIDAVLALGEHYLTHERKQDIIDAVESLEQRYPFTDKRQRALYNRLLTFGYVHGGRLIDAEMSIARGREDFPDALDFSYALCSVKNALGEHQEAIEAGQRFLSDSVDSDQDDLLDSTGERLPELLNILGSAFRDSGDIESAEGYFQQAIEADGTNASQYLNLANLMIRTDRRDEAFRVVELGLKHCGQVQELRMLRTVLEHRQTISACMIVKDEEELLGNCLDSVRDWVDEIIIVDTGSTDRTVEIAESYGAKVYHQPWEGNFSKHRNYSIGLANSDWVFIIDADEEMFVEDVPDLLVYLNDERIKAVSINVMNVYGEDEDQLVFIHSPRLFRRDINVRYEGIVHNLAVFDGDDPVVRTGVRIKHYGYDLSPEKMQKKKERSRPLLEKQLEENPNNAFAMFNLAQMLRPQSSENPEEIGPDIIKYASRAVELTDPHTKGERHIHLMCLDQLAWVHFYLKEYDKALDYCYQALEHKDNYLDPLLLIGHIHLGKKDYDEAIEQYHRYLEAQASYNPNQELDEIILQHVNSRKIVYFNLGLISFMREDLKDARRWLDKTLELNPNYLNANSWLGRVYLKESNLAKAEHHLLKQIELGEMLTDEPILLADLCLDQKRFAEAEKYYLMARDLNADSVELQLKLGRLYQETDREELASESYGRAIASTDGYPVMQKKLVDSFQRLGRHSEAALVLEKLTGIENPDSKALYDLANCYYLMERFSEAEEYYKLALSKEFFTSEAYRNLGLALARQEKQLEAIEYLEKYCELEPQAVEFQSIIGDLYSQVGEFAAALEYYEKYLRIQPEDGRAIFNFAECYRHLGHIESALLGYRRVLQLDPDFSPARDCIEELTKVVENC